MESSFRSMKWCKLHQLAAACLLLLLASELMVAQAQQRNLSDLVPPAGNSLSLSTVSRDASRTYRCLEGQWVLIRSFAALFDASNTSLSKGNYSYAYNDTSSNVTGRWSIPNSVGDISESGLQFVIVSGSVVSFVDTTDPENLDNQLVQIDSRNTVTVLGAYSYILANGTGGAAPLRACTASETVTVTFDANYAFYTQDVVPPATAKSHGVAASDTELPLQSFFCDGYANWTMQADGQWHFKSAHGALSDIPGGTFFGTFDIVPGYTITWTVLDPNGWTLVADSIRVSPMGTRDWPWMLLGAKAFRGPSFQGRRTTATFISTRGGLAPAPTGAVAAGAELGVRMSAISWMYTPTGGVPS